MGKLEAASRRARRIGTFQLALLTAAALGGVVLIAAMMPNAAQLLKYFPGYKKGAKFNYQTKSALGRLADQGLIVFASKKGNRYARITPAGERALQMESMRSESLRKRRWDGRWRVVIFDIPEYRKGVRASLRRFMREYGFIRLQDSVWVYPYDCEDLITLVKANFRVGTDVLYMIVEQIEHDKHLREHFTLK